MVQKGVDSSDEVHPILVDSSGRAYVILTDGTDIALVTGAGRLMTQPTGVYPDGNNLMPSGDATARPLFIKLTDGTNDALFEADDANIAAGQTTLVVINLNYVFDGAKWVPMTQP